MKIAHRVLPSTPASTPAGSFSPRGVTSSSAPASSGTGSSGWSPASSASRAARTSAVLVSGSRGEPVRQLQHLLKLAGFAVTADGVMGPKTTEALMEFQKKAGLQADGKAGPRTMAALNRETLPELIKLTMPSRKADAAALATQLEGVFTEFGMNTLQKRAMFLAQVGHESQDLTRTSENLNYSAAGLLDTFPKYFDKVTARDYARQPERIANRVYGSRLGNGDEASGDGWRYRGRGAIQVTGKDNYQMVGEMLDLDLVKHPELLEDPQVGLRAAGAWWKANRVNELVDRVGNDVRKVTLAVNNGTNGLADRRERYKDGVGVRGLSEDAETRYTRALGL